jgi:hypothetical protein
VPRPASFRRNPDGSTTPVDESGRPDPGPRGRGPGGYPPDDPGRGGNPRADSGPGGYRAGGRRRPGYPPDDPGRGRNPQAESGPGGYRSGGHRRTGYPADDPGRGGYPQAESGPGGYRAGGGRGTGYPPDDPGRGGYPQNPPGRGGYPPDDFGSGGYPPDDPGANGYPADGPGRGRGNGTAVRPPRGRKRKRRRLWSRLWSHRWFKATMAVVLACLLWVSWSVGHALTNPGGGTVSERLAEWARDHYLGPVVTLGEWITYKAPKVGGKPSFALTGPSAAAAKAAKHRLHHKGAPVYPAPAALQPLVAHPLAGEGTWRVLGTDKGQPAIFGTYLRASSVYTSYVAGIVSMNQHLVRFQLHPGAEDPGPGPWKSLPYIQPSKRPGLLATFNGGFKIATSGGGFYLNGGTSGTLTKGIASVVYYKDGHIAIGNWGGSVTMTPDVVGVRQNLHMVVHNGRIPPAVDFNTETSWGATLGGGYQRRADHLRLRAVAERAGSRHAAPACRRGDSDGAGHQPGLDVVHVLPAEEQSSQPDPRQPAS